MVRNEGCSFTLNTRTLSIAPPKRSLTVLHCHCESRCSSWPDPSCAPYTRVVLPGVHAPPGTDALTNGLSADLCSRSRPNLNQPSLLSTRGKTRQETKWAGSARRHLRSVQLEYSRYWEKVTVWKYITHLMVIPILNYVFVVHNTTQNCPFIPVSSNKFPFRPLSSSSLVCSSILVSWVSKWKRTMWCVSSYCVIHRVSQTCPTIYDTFHLNIYFNLFFRRLSNQKLQPHPSRLIPSKHARNMYYYTSNVSKSTTTLFLDLVVFWASTIHTHT